MGGVHAEVGGVDGVIVQQEGQRDHDAAAHDEGQHVGNTVHQVLVHGVGRAVGGTGRIACGLVFAVVDGHLAPHDLQDQLFGLVDAVVHAGEEHRLAVKAGSLHVLVRRHDDAVAGRDLLTGSGCSWHRRNRWSRPSRAAPAWCPPWSAPRRPCRCGRCRWGRPSQPAPGSRPAGWTGR